MVLELQLLEKQLETQTCEHIDDMGRPLEIND